MSSQRSKSSYSSQSLSTGFGGNRGQASFSSNRGMGGISLSGSMSLGSVQGNEKQAMQSLNDRLANFMNKVAMLEKTNQELELKIKELVKGKGSQDADYESYYGIITDLRAKIISQIMENAQISLEIDNARLAADDFKTKLDNEFALRTSVEADIDNLHGLHEEYMMASSSMEGELELLQDELNFMKKNHAEEVAALKAQISGSNMSVEIDAKQGPDIKQILDDMRKRYETTIANNRAEAEQAFQQQVEQVQQVAVQQDQAAASAKNEVTEIRQSMQSLQTELGTLQGQIGCLEDTLDETQFRKQQELESYLKKLEKVERDLENARMEINTKKHDYAKLLDEKMKLEAEIETYRRLLDGGGSGVGKSSSSSSYSGGMQSGTGGAGSRSGGTGSGSGGASSGIGELSLEFGGRSSGSGGTGGSNDQIRKTQSEVIQAPPPQREPIIETRKKIKVVTEYFRDGEKTGEEVEVSEASIE